MTNAEQPDLFSTPPTPRKSHRSDPPAAAKAASPSPPSPSPDSPPRTSSPSKPPTGPSPLRRLMDSNFLQYASYVICDRAVPALEDGLKPVQRRILWALHRMDDGRFIKVANVVGHTMQYHPHGDASITDALVNLENKGYLIEGQGNFGNLITGDSAAAARYIECRLTDLARRELFHDALTPLIPSYDGRNQEPVVLPCRIPLLLMLGAEGIAVGLSTRILPHNFIELLKSQIAILRKRSFTLLPDFPQGGLMDASEYDDGRGRVRVRARIRLKEKSACTLVVTEIPFGVTTESLIASIEEATRAGKVPVRAIHDYTAAQPEIEIVLSPGSDPERARQALYAFTACEQSLTSRIVVIKDNRPVEMDVRAVLKANTERLLQLLEGDLRHRRRQLIEEIHAKTLIQLFVENRIYKRLESCRSEAALRNAVREGLAPFRAQLQRDLTEADVEMLLGIRIRRISQFDREENERQRDVLAKELAAVEADLGAIVPYAIRYLQNLIRTYESRYPRRTELASFEAIEVRSLTARELAIRLDRTKGYLGHGVEGETLFECSSLDKIILVWNDGRYKVIPPPEKLFTDTTLVYAGKYDRDRVMTLVYEHDGITYLKRFAFGGAIQNKEYRCAPPDSRILFFHDAECPLLYVRYKPAKHQRIHQQTFDPKQVAVKGVQSRGNQMTCKRIDRIAAGPEKPRWWQEETEAVPPGVLC